METMDIDQLASYLSRDVREVGKLVSRGQLPGRKVGGQWRFARAEINAWVESQLHTYNDEQLAALEASQGEAPLLEGLLTEATVAIPLPATTRSSVLRELVQLAGQSWQVYDPEAVLEAVKGREDKASTALPSGVAIPHPHRPLPNALGDSVVAFGRTGRPIPFGGTHGLTDLFFLVCCKDNSTHLRVLARLTRLFLRPGFLDDLRAAESSSEALEVILAAERDLLAS